MIPKTSREWKEFEDLLIDIRILFTPLEDIFVTDT